MSGEADAPFDWGRMRVVEALRHSRDVSHNIRHLGRLRPPPSREAVIEAIHGIGDRESRHAAVAEILPRVGLTPDIAARRPHQLSGGQRQRIGLARALMLKPDLLVLDEPVSALDVSVQAQTLNLLRELQQAFGLTYVFIGHDLAVAEYFCDRIAVMQLGRIVETGPASGVFAAPQHTYTQALVAAIPRLARPAGN